MHVLNVYAIACMYVYYIHDCMYAVYDIYYYVYYYTTIDYYTYSYNSMHT